MAHPKAKPARREAGRSKFRLPERPPRVVETNPLREILQEAKAQEEALQAQSERHTPAKKIAGVSVSPAARIAPKLEHRDTPALNIAGVSRETLPSPVAPAAKGALSFTDFSKTWGALLRSGQLSVCRVLFELTHGAGQTECFTSMPKLAEAAGIKERQCYNIVGQLEQLGFIDRPEIYNTPTKKGTVFRLHLTPRPGSNDSDRRYHIGAEPLE